MAAFDYGSIAHSINPAVSGSGVSRRVAENELQLRVVFQPTHAQSQPDAWNHGQEQSRSHLCGGSACEW